MRKHRLIDNQQGLVAIIVSLILMIILSLIVLGFATNTRREQRQSLDRQLNSRAFYAAETGINDARQYIKGKRAAGADIERFDKCGNGPGPNIFNFTNTGFRNDIEGGSSYPCLLIDPTPHTITYGSLPTTESVAFPIKSATTTPIDQITVSWQDSSGGGRSYGFCLPVGTFPKGNSWPVSTCSAGVLRIDLVPVKDLDRNSLITNTKSFLLQPSPGSSATIGFGAITPGQVIGVNCAYNTSPTTAAPKDCNVTIMGLTVPEGYYMRVRPIYRNTSMQFSGPAGSTFEGVQALVDSTGKSSDILKRLQVRLSINALESDNNTTFDYAIQSLDSICKQYSVIPAPTSTVSNANTSGDPSCSAP